VFLIALGKDLAYLCAERVSIFFMSCFMLDSLESGVLPVFQNILTLIERVDYDLYPIMAHTKGNMSFAVPWILTWFSHDLADLEIIKRIYDVCICHD